MTKVRVGGRGVAPSGILLEPPNPASHALDVADEAHRMILAKYAAGQREHGGLLWKKRGIIDMAIEEAVDQVIYLLTLRDQLAEAGVTLGHIDEQD